MYYLTDYINIYQSHRLLKLEGVSKTIQSSCLSSQEEDNPRSRSDFPWFMWLPGTCSIEPDSPSLRQAWHSPIFTTEVWRDRKVISKNVCHFCVPSIWLSPLAFSTEARPWIYLGEYDFVPVSQRTQVSQGNKWDNGNENTF